MSTISQPLAASQAGSLVATRVRWTHVAPTLLVVWIVSMFDKSNISLVIADPQFLGTSWTAEAVPNPPETGATTRGVLTAGMLGAEAW